uniref:Uncharacterized protein n=1 Tax=Arundo donax TaxID=35708 RepID=A0A0A9C1E7_ARUDO
MSDVPKIYVYQNFVVYFKQCSLFVLAMPSSLFF